MSRCRAPEGCAWRHCVICAGHLEATEPQTCVACLGGVRRALADVVSMFAVLPSVLGHPSGARLDGSPSSEVEPPIPGGDALVMLAAGSSGLSEGPDTFRVDDPPSVAFELSQWEDDWRSCHREPAAPGPASVVSAAGYLSARAGWAADHHPAFDEFASDLRRLRSRLEVACAMDARPMVGVPCFEDGCGVELRREWTASGLSDDWRCPRCRRVYDHGSYFLAVRAHLEESKA